VAKRSSGRQEGALTDDGATRGAVERRLPGRARPGDEVLREYQELNARRRQRINSALWVFFAPDPDGIYRWRVQLDCDCVTEAMTWGDDHLPADQQWPDYAHQARLPAGQMRCRHDDPPPTVYRQITDWSNRREVSFPADPLVPPDWVDANTWAIMRHDEPHSSAFWTVTLTCGHVTEVPTDLDWNPTDGPRRTSPARQREMTAEFEEFWAAQPDAQSEREREHTRRMLANGWPMPRPEQLCHVCPDTRLITAYQRIGWLVPRQAPPKPPKPPSRATLQRRLDQAQAEVERLYEQLARLDANAQAHGDR
jgi:hypothetical protein